MGGMFAFVRRAFLAAPAKVAPKNRQKRVDG
jgi:hypothetical protein